VVDEAWQLIADAIARGDVAEVVERLEALDEADRRRLSTHAQRAAKAIPDEDRWAHGFDAELRHARATAADAAVFGTGGAAAGARSLSFLRHHALRERLVRARSREWRQDWAERAMGEREISPNNWKIAHRMVKEGAIERPAAPGYVTGAVEGMHDYDEGDVDRRRPHLLAATLRAEPEWLAEELWRLFEVEETALSSHDSWHQRFGQTWHAALRELAADGTISRARLLDETLAALRRDFSPHNARWYHKLHEALEPTPEEHVARLDELLALLASSDAAVVGFSLRALDRLERKGVLPADLVLDAIPPAIALPVKGHASRGVKLVGSIVARDPSVARIAAPALTQALAHESRDVQDLAVGVLERHADALEASDREQLAALATAVDPALRSRVDALAGTAPAASTPAGAAVAVPPRQTPDPDASRLTAPALEPPADVGELLDRIAVALERGDDPDEIELLLDGVSRLRHASPDSGRVHALLERVLALSAPWQGHVGFHHARSALAVALLRWLGGREHRKVQLDRTGSSPREAIAMRVRELVDELPGGRPRRLLATPTHPGGWIDPLQAVHRIAELEGRRPPPMVLSQLVLRFAPDGREEARAAAAGIDGEAAAVLLRALGGPARPPRLSRLKVAWAAAEHARDPQRFELPRRRLDDYDARHASWFEGDSEIKRASPAELLVLEQSWWGWERGGIERWLTTVWPANRESVFDLVVRRLWINHGDREYGIEDVLEVLLDDAEPVGSQAALAVALALGSADITHRALAADITIAALKTRRLDGETLGTKFVLMLRRQQAAVPARWAASLADVAAAGPLAAHDVQVAIEKILAVATEDDRRRLLGLVDLIRRLAVDADAAITNPRAREWLSSLSRGSKIGRAGREALTVGGDGAARSRAAAAEARASVGVGR
jgi:hypothetical protein